jgi:alpha-D-xyloside xylohydrolase
MKRLSYFLLLLMAVACNQAGFEQTETGVIIPVKKTNEKVRLECFTENIIRVSVAKPGEDFPAEASLMVNLKPDTSVAYTIAETGSEIQLQTSRMTALVNKQTGTIRFLDANGDPILQEKERAYGSNIDPNLPETSFQVVFDSPDDEAFYGLGQHQNGEVNYKGLDVELQQNNIVAVVPFLYSNKKYGLLWDNYSITRFGDPRTYGPVSSLKLYDAEWQ